MKSNFDIIREYRSLKQDVEYPFVELENESHLQKKGQLQNLTEAISKVTHVEIVMCKDNLMLALEHVLGIQQQNVNGYSLSRNQGLIIENYFYQKLFGILDNAMNACTGFSYAPFYYERDGTFETKHIFEFIQDFYAQLKQRDFYTYFELEEYFESYKTNFFKLV